MRTKINPVNQTRFWSFCAKFLSLIIAIFCLLFIKVTGTGCGRLGNCVQGIEPSLQAGNAEVYHASFIRVLDCLTQRGDPRALRFHTAVGEIVRYFAYEEGLHPEEFDVDYVNAEALTFLHGKTPDEIIAFADQIRERSYALSNNLEMKRRQREADEKGWDIQLPLMPVPDAP